MSLLPKSEVEFAQAHYWDRFFRERGTKEFEWYGEFAELCEPLLKYLKTQDSTLVIGCGNSMLSSHLFDFGYRNITNIDISSVVIRQMKIKVGKNRPEMIFEQMDALNMTYDKETFTVVLDKGTLDALMPKDTDNDRSRAKQLFSEINKILKLNGRYIIISLLQEHVLKAVLDYFCEIGWMIRITRCWDVEKRYIAEEGTLTMPVFMIVCVKLRTFGNLEPILEMNLFVDGKSKRVTSKEQVMAVIKGIQGSVFHSRESEGEVEMTFFSHEQEMPRYTIYLSDVSKDQRKLLKYAAFIVPRGRETEWMFGCEDGRRYLRESSGYDRLAIITFHRNQNYGSLVEVQDELRETVLQLAPPIMPVTTSSPNIPYLTLGDGLGQRDTIFSGCSAFSGDILVEDIEIDHEIFRRLIFMNNQAVVQSEVKMKKGANKKKVVDPSHVASHHALYMSISAAVKESEDSLSSIAVVGVGGGGLCSLLRRLFPAAAITGVEIDPLVVEVAQKYFGLVPDDRLHVLVRDGIEFLKENNKFDIIMYDVDSKERGAALSCPPPDFIEHSTLKAVSDSLGTEGIFVTNVVSRLNSEHERLLKRIKEHFTLVSWYNLKEDVNRIVFATNMKGKSNDEWIKRIKEGALALEKNFKKTLKSSNNSVDVDHLLANLTI